MKKSVKIALIVVAVLVVLIAVAAGVFWYMMNKPLYEPGMVRAEKNLSAPLSPPDQAADSPRWDMGDDIELYHFAAGDGKNVLIVHGGPGNSFAEPLPALESLTDRYRFHYYDQRGCGQSTRPFDRFESGNFYQNALALDRTLGLGAQLADIERIRRILGDDKLILIGHSFGGFLASLYAAEFPEHIQALILIAPASVLVMPQDGDDLFAAIEQRLPEAAQSEFDAFMKDYLDFGKLFSRNESELVEMNRRLGKYYQTATGLQIAEHQGDPGGWIAPAAYVSMGLQHDYRGALSQVDAPVLVIHGTADLQSEAVSRMYADAFPNATFETIENASHFPFFDQPEAFAVVVGDFLQSAAAATSSIQTTSPLIGRIAWAGSTSGW